MKFPFREGLLLSAYFLLKRFRQSDQRGFGLDKSDVIVEQVPLVYQRVNGLKLLRITKQNASSNSVKEKACH